MKPAASRNTLIEDSGYLPLKRYLIETTGLAYYTQHDEILSARIKQRLQALDVSNCSAYLDLLHTSGAGAEELDQLVEALTIGETFFYRHQEQFDALRHTVFPELLKKSQAQRRLRIWSAGCATGAEPYTIAILLQREFGHLLAGWEVTILGTDINRQFLAQAQRGEFGDWAFRSDPYKIKESCFDKTGRLWTVKPEYRRFVSFQYHNLVQHPFPSPASNLHAFDVILCRNVMIYFDREIIRKCVGQFYDSLVDDGWLLVGHAEPDVSLFQAFQAVNAPGAVLYRKTPSPSVPTHAVEPAFPLAHFALPPTWASAPLPTPLATFETTILPPSLPSTPPLRTTSPKPVETSEDVQLAELRALIDSGCWEQAIRGCREWIEREGLNPTVHFYHASALSQAGQAEEAIRSLRRALYLDRNFALAHYYLGLLLQRSGETAAARRALRNAQTLLDAIDAGVALHHADGLTAGDLSKLTQMQLAILEQA